MQYFVLDVQLIIGSFVLVFKKEKKEKRTKTKKDITCTASPATRVEGSPLCFKQTKKKCTQINHNKIINLSFLSHRHLKYIHTSFICTVITKSKKQTKQKSSSICTIRHQT